MIKKFTPPIFTFEINQVKKQFVFGYKKITINKHKPANSQYPLKSKLNPMKKPLIAALLFLSITMRLSAQSDLTPSVMTSILNFNATEENVDRDFILVLNEIAGNTTTGLISVRIIKPSAFNISFDVSSGTSNVFGGVPNENADFTFSDAGAFYLLTTNAVISANSYKIAGLKISRKTGILANTTQSVTIQIMAGSGSDVNSGNNVRSLELTAN